VNNDKFNVINKTKKFIEFIDSVVINYPRREYVLKDKMITTSYDLLEFIYLGNVSEDKIDIQKKILSKISMLDFYLEQSYNKECISLKKMQNGSRQLNEIRKMVYGWIKENAS